MLYDKYRNWPLPRRISSPFQKQDLEAQVLKDLAATGDEVEKLEILDSYAAYAQRAYREELAGLLSNQILFIVHPFLTAAILGKLPGSVPLSRPRMAPGAEKGDKDGFSL